MVVITIKDVWNRYLVNKEARIEKPGARIPPPPVNINDELYKDQDFFGFIFWP